MNFADCVVIFFLILIFGAAVYSIIKKRKNGSVCGCNCGTNCQNCTTSCTTSCTKNSATDCDNSKSSQKN